MRQVIRRFLKHLDAEKNATVSTIDTYRYDLNKFDDYMAHRLGRRFLPGDVSRDHIRDYLMWLSEIGHQKPNGPSARARALAAIRSFFKYAHRAGLLRDNPAADIPLPKIRMGEIQALSQDECGRLIKVVETNRSPFRKLRDRAMILTFLLTGARLREIVQLDKADIDLHQSTIRLQYVWSHSARSYARFLEIFFNQIPNRATRDSSIPARNKYALARLLFRLCFGMP